MRVKINNIRPLSVLKYVAGSYLAFFVLLALIFGGLATIGLRTVRWNGEPVTGIWALPVAMLICIMMWLGSTICTWVALIVGFPIFRLVQPLDIEGDASDEAAQQTGSS